MTWWCVVGPSFDLAWAVERHCRATAATVGRTDRGAYSIAADVSVDSHLHAGRVHGLPTSSDTVLPCSHVAFGDVPTAIRNG